MGIKPDTLNIAIAYATNAPPRQSRNSLGTVVSNKHTQVDTLNFLYLIFAEGFKKKIYDSLQLNKRMLCI